MAKATPAQYEKAIENYRRHASDSRIAAGREVEGSWQQRADLRNAVKFDKEADDLERMKVLRIEQDIRVARLAQLYELPFYKNLAANVTIVQA